MHWKYPVSEVSSSTRLQSLPSSSLPLQYNLMGLPKLMVMSICELRLAVLVGVLAGDTAVGEQGEPGALVSSWSGVAAPSTALGPARVVSAAAGVAGADGAAFGAFGARLLASSVAPPPPRPRAPPPPRPRARPLPRPHARPLPRPRARVFEVEAMGVPG